MIAINPFLDDIVREPREIEAPVPGLNAAPLEGLLAFFANLERHPIPRNEARPDHALLVTSPEPGYGKSHLMGRLFDALGERATLVNVHTFQNPEGGWNALLLSAVQEMRLPGRLAPLSKEAPPPSQMTSLANGVIIHMVADLLHAQGRRPKALEKLRQNPALAFQSPKDWSAWRKTLAPIFSDPQGKTFLELKLGVERRLPRLNARPESWLRWLYAAGPHPEREELARGCEDWLTARPLDPQEAERIGIHPADRGDDGIVSPDDAKRRLSDLCRIAGYHRPFLFCFDQTESYGSSPALARELGNLVMEMQQDLVNQLTVITANLDPWEKRVQPHWEAAARDRLAPQLALEGLSRQQGEAWIRLRLELLKAEGTPGAAHALDPAWLAEAFRERSRMGARTFLQLCGGRWNHFSETTRQPQPTPQPIAPLPPTIESSFDDLKRRLERTPRRLQFQPEQLLWAAQLALSDGAWSREKDGAMVWRGAGKNLRLRLEGSDQWQTWRRIAQQTLEEKEKNMAQICLRTREQGPIPRPSWSSIGPLILQAMTSGMRVERLETPMLTDLYAGWDLYADAMAGDAPHAPEAVLAFLRLGPLLALRRLILDQPLAEAVIDLPGLAPPVPAISKSRAPIPAQSGREMGAGELTAKLRDLLQREKMLSETEVLTKLGAPIDTARLHAARERVPEIHLFTAPEMTVWLWKNS